LKKTTIVIVGLGLIGGSLAAALKKFGRKQFHVVGLTRSMTKVRQAKRKKWIDEGYTQPKPALRHADLVVLCGPLHLIAKTAKKIDAFIPQGCVVTDVGSVKGEICAAVKKAKLKKGLFVGAHPMAGSHLTGMAHGSADLYKGATVYITPTQNTKRLAVKKVKRLWQKVGAKIKIASPKEHDNQVAATSHLPHVIAFSLASLMPAQLMQVSGSGFRDMTRMAQSDPELWQYILRTNRSAVLKWIKTYERHFKQWHQLVTRSSSQSLVRALKKTRQKRVQL